jgi:hypothetical protein
MIQVERRERLDDDLLTVVRSVVGDIEDLKRELEAREIRDARLRLGAVHEHARLRRRDTTSRPQKRADG